MIHHACRSSKAPSGSSGLRLRQTGVGLIEVLVAVLVLAIGFLGVAALEANSLSTNNSAMARTMATLSTYSILDGMRADIVNARAGSYGTPVVTNACPTTTATFAQTQMAGWCEQLRLRLGESPNTQGTVACLATGECTVTIQFDDSRAGKGGAADQTVVTKAIL